MRKTYSLIGGLLTLAALLLTPWPVAEAVPQDRPPEQAGIFGEIIEVRLINLEAVVTDKEGQRVTGLSPNDFRLLVDGEEIPIEYFSEVRSGVAMESTGIPLGMELAPGTAVGEPVGTSYLIFIDDFFTINRDRNLVLDQMIEHVGSLGPEDRVAVVAFDGRDLEMLSSWSSSVPQVQAILRQARERPSKGLQRLTERSRFDDANQIATVSELLRYDDRQVSLDAYLTPEERFYANMLAGQVERAVQAASATLRSFAQPPGRKVMLLAMGSWPFLPADFVVSDIRRPLFEQRVAGGGELFRPLTETANRLGYTLYPVDVPGFDRSQGDITANLQGGQNGRIPYNTALTDPRTGVGRQSAFVREQEAHYTMQFLAEETGGQAFLNSQRLEAFDAARTDTRSYYWLGFTPQWKGDDSYHDIRIELVDPSLEIRSRSGFLDLSRVQETTMVVESALLFGGPASEELLTLRFGRPKKEGFRKMMVPLTVEVPFDKVTFLPTAEGQLRAQLELRVAVIDKTGAQAEIPVIPLMLEVPSEPPPGEVYSYEVTLKMRRERHRTVVAVYDQASGSMLSGTAEISP